MEFYTFFQTDVLDLLRFPLNPIWQITVKESNLKTYFWCTYDNISWVMEFLTCWVLKSKVFVKKSYVVKWNCELTYCQGLKKCQNHTFKVIFLCQKIMEFKKKSERFKWFLKAGVGHFLTSSQWMNSQNSPFSFEYSWFFDKNLAF